MCVGADLERAGGEPVHLGQSDTDRVLLVEDRVPCVGCVDAGSLGRRFQDGLWNIPVIHPHVLSLSFGVVVGGGGGGGVKVVSPVVDWVTGGGTVSVDAVAIPVASIPNIDAGTRMSVSIGVSPVVHV